MQSGLLCCIMGLSAATLYRPRGHPLCALQAQKVYVQDRLKESGELVWKLLHEQGAHFYVCGDAANMAGAVEKQLLQVRGGGVQDRWENCSGDETATANRA